MRRVRRRGRWTERRDSSRLRETARKVRGGSKRCNYRVHLPKIHRTHALSYNLRRFVKREELPEVVCFDLIDNCEVAYIGTKAWKVTTPKKRINK